MYTKRNFKNIINEKFSKVYNSNIYTNQYKYYSFMKQRKWTVSLAFGISLLAALQYRYLKNYITQDNNVYEPFNILAV